MKVMHIPLGPVLKLKSTAEVKALLPTLIAPASPAMTSSATTPLLTTASLSTSLSESTSLSSSELLSSTVSTSASSPQPLEIPANHLTAELLQIQLLLSLPSAHASSTQEIKHEAKENKMLFQSDLPSARFELAYDICCDARDLFSIAIPDLKITPEHSSILEPKVERLNAILSASAKETFSIDNLRNVFNIINTIDGILKYHQNYGVAANIQEMLAQLKTEIKKSEKIKPLSPLIEKSLFSMRSAEVLPFGLLSNEQKTNDIRKGM
jgi:hypothetical protein